MKTMKKPFGFAFVAAIVLLLSFDSAEAAFIDFESVPGDSPFEGLEISSQFLATAGVTFSLEGGGVPLLAEVGPPRTAFNPDDTPAAGQGIGSFFLTDTGDLSSTSPPPLIITFSNPTGLASGVLLDIDSDETWTLEAFDSADVLLDTIILTDGDPGTGNALATEWAFNRISNDIHRIRLTGSHPGTTAAFGLGFDNFETGIIPEPSTALLLASGLVAMAVGRGRMNR